MANSRKPDKLIQVPRQSSVIGAEVGVGGSKNNFWRSAKIFSSNAGVKTSKKVFSSQIRSVSLGRLPFFGGTIFSLGGHFFAWGGGARRVPVVQISDFAHNFRGEDQKQRSVSRNLRLRQEVHRCFSS